MKAKFVSSDKRISDFIRMAHLLGFLDSDAPKEDKVLEIKMARDDGFITEDEAVELAIEFC